jgi:glycosyltransferase involved in cell wall biosynthesis
MDDSPFTASIIIPCRNAAATVGASVRTALTQTVRPLEVLVIDDASSDSSAEAANSAGARVIRLEQRSNAGGARNRGIEAARGNVLAFLDADVEIAPDWLAIVKDVLASDPFIVAVGGRIFNDRPNVWAELDLLLNHSEWISDNGRLCGSYPTMAIAYRREAVGKIRFPPTNFGEDTFFALAVRAQGGQIWYEPRIRILHKHERLDSKQFWHRQIDAGQQLYWTRRSLDLPGKILFKVPILLFLFPHLWIVLGRMLRQRMVGNTIVLFPGLVLGEIARIFGFLRARRVDRGTRTVEQEVRT